MIREALVEARTELEALQTREAQLARQIADAEAALGESPVSTLGERKMTLHDALAHVLREGGNEGLTARELADAVNRRGLYHKRDGSPVEVNQVQARVNNYGSIFEKDGPAIRLLEESTMLSTTPQGFTIFRDDDDAFFDWLEEHPDGYFVNTERNPKPSYLVLHKPECPHFTGGKTLHWTKDYVKVCSALRSELEEWAVNTVGGEVTLCRSCFG
jgi:HB1, ASXL, restriction endonuclease HTH domain